MSKQEIKEEYIETYGIYNVGIYEGKRMVGRALLLNTSDLEELVLLDIYVYHEQDRRKGYADKLMWFLTRRYGDMVTSWLSTAGRDLCLKNGFVMTKSRFKGQPDLLTYRKDGPDASSEKKGSQEGGTEEGFDLTQAERVLGSPSGSPGNQGGENAQEDPQGAEGSKEGEVA